MSRCVLSLVLQTGSEPERQAVPIEQLVIAGWTGRDPAAVEKHIRELEALGVRRPAQRSDLLSRRGGAADHR